MAQAITIHPAGPPPALQQHCGSNNKWRMGESISGRCHGPACLPFEKVPPLEVACPACPAKAQRVPCCDGVNIDAFSAHRLPVIIEEDPSDSTAEKGGGPSTFDGSTNAALTISARSARSASARSTVSSGTPLAQRGFSDTHMSLALEAFLVDEELAGFSTRTPVGGPSSTHRSGASSEDQSAARLFAPCGWRGSSQAVRPANSAEEPREPQGDVIGDS
eukprot:gnl/TRDRNA2_/TRDRNA2_196133_c0_seq1.p1 gnl/TRDRNA2_/TRDRNA2_196133_c0~~gnl/TRDRNA2_/TRDRNA2_196133_c0_seq1.p1  ORF type:complete len:219 (+),score=21.86 gnl/TRDRNA2_/TRDRNA2_196133_c0_seq1:2-658(+)